MSDRKCSTSSWRCTQVKTRPRSSRHLIHFIKGTRAKLSSTFRSCVLICSILAATVQIPSRTIRQLLRASSRCHLSKLTSLKLRRVLRVLPRWSKSERRKGPKNWNTLATAAPCKCRARLTWSLRRTMAEAKLSRSSSCRSRVRACASRISCSGAFWPLWTTPSPSR